MSQTGANTVLAVAAETIFGTAVTSGFVLPFISNTVSANKALIKSAVLDGNHNPSIPAEGNIDVVGEVKIPLDNEASWYWFQLMFGDPATTGAEDPYAHVFTLTSAQPSFTLQKGFTQLATDRHYYSQGCKISSVTFEFGGDGELMATLSIMGATEDAQETTIFSVGETTIAQTEKYSNLNGSMKEGGGATAIIETFSITVDFNLDGSKRAIASGGVRTSIPKGKAMITGSIKAFYDIAGGGEAILAKALAGTESSLEITLTPADANHTLIIDINELLYSYKSPEVPGPEGLVVDLTFEGYYNNDAGESGIIITLSNASAHA
jgi:hypothetical protein